MKTDVNYWLNVFAAERNNLAAGSDAGRPLAAVGTAKRCRAFAVLVLRNTSWPSGALPMKTRR